MSGEARHAIDLEALLVALVLAPATYPRNRFFALYQNPEVRRVRRRASHLRGLVRQVAATRSDAVRVAPGPDHRVLVRYEVPALGLRRRVLLEPIEARLIDVVRTPPATAEALVETLGLSDGWRADLLAEPLMALLEGKESAALKSTSGALELVWR